MPLLFPPVAILALVVAVAGLAALAAGGWLLLKHFDALACRIASLEASIPKAQEQFLARYAPPVADVPTLEVPDVDVAGAWAQELAAAGIRVTDEEINLQRRMRLEAGL